MSFSPFLYSRAMARAVSLMCFLGSFSWLAALDGLLDLGFGQDPDQLFLGPAGSYPELAASGQCGCSPGRMPSARMRREKIISLLSGEIGICQIAGLSDERQKFHGSCMLPIIASSALLPSSRLSMGHLHAPAEPHLDLLLDVVRQAQVLYDSIPDAALLG